MADYSYCSCPEPMCRSCNDHTTGHRDGKGRALSEVSTLTTDWRSCTGFALRKSQPRAG